MQEMIDRFCRMRDTEPSMTIDHFGRYEKIIYFFNIDMIMTIEEFGGVMCEEILEMNFEHRFLRINSVIDKKLITDNEKVFLELYKEWTIEHILLGN